MVSGTRRVDLVLPAAIPVIDLLPELARSVGVLDRVTASSSYHVLTGGGRVLHNDLGLSAQGVDDGAVLVVSSYVDDCLPLRHDDVAEAMASLARDDSRSGGTAAPGPVGLVSATALLLITVLALLAVHERGMAPAFALSVAAVTVLAAVVFSRAHGDAVAAVTLGNLGCVVAAAGAGCSAWHTSVSGVTIARAGGALTFTAVVTALMIGRGRMLLLPVGVIGAVTMVSGILVTATIDPAPFLTGLLVVVVVSGGRFPGLALSATGAGRHTRSLTFSENVSPEVDLPALERDLELAREILVAVSLTTGLLLALIAPEAVRLGSAGATIPVLSSLVVMLRSRRYVAAVDVLVARISGVVGIVVSLVSTVCLDDWSRVPVAVATTTIGVAVLMVRLSPRTGDVRRQRLGDILESLSLGALLPALVLATGVSVVWA